MSHLLKFNNWMLQICQTVTEAKARDDEWVENVNHLYTNVVGI